MLYLCVFFVKKQLDLCMIDKAIILPIVINILLDNEEVPGFLLYKQCFGTKDYSANSIYFCYLFENKKPSLPFQPRLYRHNGLFEEYINVSATSKY